MEPQIKSELFVQKTTGNIPVVFFKCNKFFMKTNNFTHNKQNSKIIYIKKNISKNVIYPHGK